MAYRQPKEIKKDFNELEALFKNKKINPEIYKVFKLSEATKALNFMADRKNVGKIVLEC